MEPDRSDTNLLFGILAVKMNFIAKEDLFVAMGIWFLDRRKALGEILVERRALSGRDRDLLDAMVRESQSRQGQPVKSGSHDRPDAPTRPSDSIGPTEAPAVEPVRSPSENGHFNDGDMTITWAARREQAGDEPYVVLRPHAKGGSGPLAEKVRVRTCGEHRCRRRTTRGRIGRTAAVSWRVEAT